jgi:cell fate (sporulation/competence/biofilm development) regulator YmcA (YheA/YmcA/DUF963 family)
LKPQWDAQIEQLDTAINLWRSLTPRLPQTFATAQGVTVPTADASLMFEETIAMMKVVNESALVNAILLGIHQPGVLNPIPAIVGAVSNLNSNPVAQFIDQIAQNLWAIRASLVWLVPSSAVQSDMVQMVRDMELEGKIQTLETLSNGYTKFAASAAALQAKISENEQLAIAALDKLKAYEREGSTAKTNTDANAASAAGNKEAIEKQLRELTTGIENYKTLLGEINDLKHKATSTLESTSKVALAASFSDRKTILGKDKSKWEKWFGLGIILLVVAGTLSVIGFFTLPPVIQSGTIEIGPLITRLVLIGPLIWFTWFSARQYGNTARLIEDYAFKEASALAFVGYQREMSQDSEMIKLLRESAIKNFGNQPTRIFDKTDPASPLHELLDKALEKGTADKFIELIKALNPMKP